MESLSPVVPRLFHLVTKVGNTLLFRGRLAPISNYLIHQNWLLQLDLNQWPTAYRAVALPTELWSNLATSTGFEPMTNWLTVNRSTYWANPSKMILLSTYVAGQHYVSSWSTSHNIAQRRLPFSSLFFKSVSLSSIRSRSTQIGYLVVPWVIETHFLPYEGSTFTNMLQDLYSIKVFLDI